MSQRSGVTVQVSIPPLPKTFSEVITLYKGSQDAPMEQLIEIIQQDAATASYILQRVNSAYYGLKRPVSTIDRAITILGFMPVCNVLLAVGVKKVFSQLTNPLLKAVYDYLMQTSLATGLFAREMATHLNHKLPDTMFAAGLLAQFGRLVMLFNFKDDYARLWLQGETPEEGLLAPDPGREQALFRANYIDVGENVGKLWRFPDEILGAIRHHLQPTEVTHALLREVALAVAASLHAAQALYAVKEEKAGSSFFGFSAPLAGLARAHEVPGRELLDLLAEKREAVREFADSILTT